MTAHIEHRLGEGSGQIIIRLWPATTTAVDRVQIHTWPPGYGPNITQADQLRALGDTFRGICHDLADGLGVATDLEVASVDGPEDPQTTIWDHVAADA